MKLFLDLEAFLAETGCIYNRHKLLEIGISSRFGDSYFFRDEVPKLRELCRMNPKLHIVSLAAPLVMVNYCDERAGIFRLASGNPDSDIKFYDTVGMRWPTIEDFKRVMAMPE